MTVETTRTSSPAWSMDVRGFPAVDVVPDALILQASTVAGAVEGDDVAVRVPYANDATAQFVAEGADIAEADPELAEVVVMTGKVAQLVRVSREQLAQADASTLLTASLSRAVTRAANAAFISQAAPTSPAVTPPAGLLNVAGITNGGAVASNLDTLVDAIAGIEADYGTATHIVCDPTAWASLSKLKSQTGAATALLGAGVEAGARQLLGVPVLVSPSVGTGKLLVLDKAAVVSAVGQVILAQSDHAYFGSDSIGLRCTFRFGANVVHPARIVKMTVTPPA
ncbi:phage major capsid protein [Rhodococcus sp. X156]|uniref:phage major capsid protein n=1 Tax=Rhodococcus sp. X156 TaxID=2499145 RepID=UPI000FDC2A72|nr:phage major capsid protein [Rhodococcus sp. X156]